MAVMLTPLLPLGTRRTYPTRLFWCVLPCLLTACAQGIGFEEDYMQSDGGVVVDTSVPRQDSATPSADTGVSPSYDSSVGPTQDTSVPPVDAGGPIDEEDASVAPTQDAATPPRDAGADTSTPVTMDAGTTDTGTPVTMDSGPEAGPPDTGGPATPDTSTNPNQCSAVPAYPTTTECAKCVCSKCGTQVKQCYASGETAKDANCAKVQECAEKNKCVDQACYCTDTLSCLGTPNGPCVSVIEQVAGTNNALDISRLGDDTSHPLGRAAAIGACELQNCRSQCGL